MERIARTHLPATFFEADAVVTLAGTADIEKGVGSRKQDPVGILQESSQSADFSAYDNTFNITK